MKYILFVGQEANFCSRVILIPYEEFLKVRNKDYELMKKHSQKSVMIDGVLVDNLLEQKIIMDGNVGSLEKREYTEICEKLNHYADWGSEYASNEDKLWLSKSKYPKNSNFNHVLTYSGIIKKYRKNTKYNIVDSFLYLELDNVSPYDTVEEMYEEMYNH